MKLNLLLIAGLFCFSYASKAQVTSATPKTTYVKPTNSYKQRVDTVKNTDPSLNGQYRFMLSRSRTAVGGYKLVNPNRLNGLWKSVSDTLSREKIEIVRLSKKITSQEKTINYLKTEITSKESSLNENSNRVNEIKFLGIAFDKGNYSIMVWSIICALALALVIVITRSAKNILEAKHRTQLYDEIAQEYQNFKTKANEKERKLARELQDERNRIDEITNGRR